MAVHALGSRGAVEQVVQQFLTFILTHAHDVVGRPADHQRAPAGAVLPDERVLLAPSRAPHRELLRCRVGCHASLGRLEAVEDAERVEPLLLLLGQVVVRGVGARELRLAALPRDFVRSEQRRLDGRLVVGRRAAVDLPVESPAQILRRRVLLGVERDAVDPRYEVVRRRLVDLAQPLAERDLGLRVHVQTTEHQDAVRLERGHDLARELVVRQQPVAIDAHDFGTNGVGELVGRGNRHGRTSRSAVQPVQVFL